VLVELEADCDWSTSPPYAFPLVASPEPQRGFGWCFGV
jgi:hypothetical protein